MRPQKQYNLRKTNIWDPKSNINLGKQIKINQTSPKRYRDQVFQVSKCQTLTGTRFPSSWDPGGEIRKIFWKRHKTHKTHKTQKILRFRCYFDPRYWFSSGLVAIWLSDVGFPQVLLLFWSHTLIFLRFYCYLALRCWFS